MKTKMRILPITIAGAMVVLILKAGVFATDIRAFAQEQEQGKEQEHGQDENRLEMVAEDDAANDTADMETAMAVPDPLLMNRSELEILRELSTRRIELDHRDGAIQLREKLLEATENRIDEKIARLLSIENQIKALVTTHDEQENARLQSIVNVYAKMKPKNAAPIFQGLDMSIQLEVALRMKESKMAPILAAMSPDAARALTVELANYAKLPEFKG